MRRRRKFRRFLRRHRGLVIALSVVLFLFLSFYYLILYVQRYLRQARAQVEVISPDAVDLLKDPQAYFAAERGKALAEMEPFFIGLFVIIPLTFLAVAVVCFVRALQKGPAWKSSHGMSAEQQERASKHRIEIVRKMRR